MLLLELFKKNHTCLHQNVKPDIEFAYCPDCGELVENQWYLIRCACCGVKLRGVIKNGEIIPEKPFCHNCGTKNFSIERIDKINFIDINYAVLVKDIVHSECNEYTQSWVDTNQKANNKRLLLQQFQ